MQIPEASPESVEGRVVVASDGSWHSRAALEAAALEALQRGTRLDVVTLCAVEPDPDLTSGARLTQAREQLAEAQRAAERAALDVHRGHPDLPVGAHAVPVDDHAGLRHLLAGSSLLVLGSFGRLGRRSFTLGSTSREFLHAGDSPVLVVPEDGAPPRPADLPADVLAGLDERPHGLEVIRVAAEQAHRRGRHLTVLHAFHPAPGEERERALARARSWCEHQITAARIPAGVGVTHVVTPEPPTDALLRHASGAELVVIGSRGPVALAGLSLGSVSRAVLDAARRPVLVVLPSRERGNERDRAPGVLEHGPADGPEDRPPQPPTSVRPDHEQLGAVGGRDQG